MVVKYVIKTSQYFDSISLMAVARVLQDRPGVEDAALVMGTKANKALLAQAAALSTEVESADSNDLIMMVKGSKDSIDAALAAADELLTKKHSPSFVGKQHRPRTLRSAARSQQGSNLAVISVAGMYAAAQAWQALHQGLHVLLFSDNVSLEDEISLKQYAVKQGLLMMGPGAGTAIINGVALGFANVVPRGPVGIVSAAGTGLQEVSTLLSRHGVGISQGIGVGGRDLSEDVGGLMTFHALEALEADPETEVIIVISKIPSPTIVEKIIAKLASGNKPTVTAFMGADASSLVKPSEQVYVASTLHEAALAAASEDLSTVADRMVSRERELKKQAANLTPSFTSQQRYVRGLFSGGTLGGEAMQIWKSRLGDIWSNAPLNPAYRLPDSSLSREHTALDLGEEEFTVGRPHPMIDNDLRIRRLLLEAQSPEVAVIQMDIVLGYGAHLDPASELAPAIRQARELATLAGRELIVITSLTGTDHDPQNRTRQASALQSSGALVLDSNADASWLAAYLVS